MPGRTFLAVLVCFSFLAVPAHSQQSPGTRFAVAIEDGDTDAILALLEEGNSADTWIEYGEHKITPLMKAAWDGQPDIIRILLDAGAKVNAQATDTGETALLNAVSQGNLEIVQMLLEAKADVSLKNKFDFNPFTSAVAAGNIELSRTLLKAGAGIEEGAHTLSPLQFAASSGNLDMIRFLVENGADVNRGAKKGEQTALLSAIYGAKPEAVRLLVELKADVNAKTSSGDTPLSVAQNGDQTDIVEILKKAGAKK